jgi:sn-glycerol 3-phosphate transport system permease protein
MNQRSVHAWLMLLPALALLVAFTHWPAVSTLVDSFFSTPKGARPGVWVGLENYQVMAEDPVFWKAVRNNLWFAAATIPCSIAILSNIPATVFVHDRVLRRESRSPST